jgi:hypothetical protein
LGQEGVELWMPLEALAGGLRVVQAALGVRATAPATARPGLPEVFRQVVGALFTCMKRHQGYCGTRAGSEPVPLVGDLAPAAGPRAPTDPQPMIESFRNGVRDLAPLLEQILAPATWQEIQGRSARTDGHDYPDELWAATVYEAAAAHHRGPIHGEHLVKALVPLYLGRVGAFLIENGEGQAEAVEARLEAVGLSFEAARRAAPGEARPDTHEVSHG